MAKAGRSLYFGRDGAAPAEQTDAERTPPNLKHRIKRRRCSSAPENARRQVDILTKYNSWSPNDLITARQAIYELADLLEEDGANGFFIVESGAIPALVQHLWGPPYDCYGDDRLQSIEHEAEETAVAVLQHLAFNDSYRQIIINEGTLPCLITLLERHGSNSNGSSINSILHRVADAIKVLVDANDFAKDSFRNIGGVPPLVDLLESTDAKVKQAAARALLVLAYKNNENKNEIIECNPLPTLVYMIRHEDDQVCNDGMKLVEIMVSSSQNVRQEALIVGALQPIIDLLSDSVPDIRRVAAWLVSYFAEDFITKRRIAQRGAIEPLAKMLMSEDEQLQESSSYAFRLLSEDHCNAVAIIKKGLKALLDRLQSKAVAVEANVAYTLKQLSSCKDNVCDIVTAGGDRKLRHGEWHSKKARKYVGQTLRNLEENISGIPLSRLVSPLYVVPARGPADREVRINVALALAHLCSNPDQLRRIFLSKEGEVLEEIMKLLYAGSSNDQRDAAAALYALATKDIAAPPKDVVPEVYLGEEYVNNITMADATFIVEGKPFYAHRNALCRASDTFRAMFESDYWEKNADRPIEIRNISWRVFEFMMRYIYTGRVKIPSDIWQDLLVAADRYLLGGLKHFCENVVVEDISTENVAHLCEVADSCNALSLMESCVLFILEHAEQMCFMPGYCDFIMSIVPKMRDYLHRILLSRGNLPAR